MIELTVTAQAGITAGRQPQTGQLRDSHDHVPGATLRGAFARRWIVTHRGTPPTLDAALRKQFEEIFESGRVRFGPLYPTGTRIRWLSVYEHKYGHTCPDGDLDAATMPADAPLPDVCPGCGWRLEPAKGRIAVEPDTLTDRTHAALDETDRAIKEKLYTRRQIRGGTCLAGLLSGPDTLINTLLGNSATLLLGGNRTASGRIHLDSAPAGPIARPTVTGTMLTLRLYSPAIFVDSYGYPSLTPDSQQLGQILGVPVTGIARHWTRTEIIGGWHAASSLPKPTEWAVSTGSVYLIECAQQPTQAGLDALVTDGIGLRRHEGYGWVGYRIVARKVSA